MDCAARGRERTIGRNGRARPDDLSAAPALHARGVLGPRAAVRRGALRADRGGALHGSAAGQAAQRRRVESRQTTGRVRAVPCGNLSRPDPARGHPANAPHVAGARSHAGHHGNASTAPGRSSREPTSSSRSAGHAPPTTTARPRPTRTPRSACASCGCAISRSDASSSGCAMPPAGSCAGILTATQVLESAVFPGLHVTPDEVFEG